MCIFLDNGTIVLTRFSKGSLDLKRPDTTHLDVLTDQSILRIIKWILFFSTENVHLTLPTPTSSGTQKGREAMDLSLFSDQDEADLVLACEAQTAAAKDVC